MRTFRTFNVADTHWSAPAVSDDHCGLNGKVIFLHTLETFNELIDHPACAKYVHRLRTLQESVYVLYNDLLDLHLLVEKKRKFIANHADVKDSLEWAQRVEDVTAKINEDWSKRHILPQLTESTAMILIPHLCPDLRQLNRLVCMDGKLYHQTERLSTYIGSGSWKHLEEAHIAVGEADGDVGKRQLWNLLEQLLKVSTIKKIYVVDRESGDAALQPQALSDICSTVEALDMEQENTVCADDVGAPLQCTPRLEL